jgi:hypothetical protein
MDVEQVNAQTKQDSAAVQENGLLAAAFAQARAGRSCQTRWLGVQGFFSSRRALLLTLCALAIGLLAQTVRAGVRFTNGDSPIGTLVQGRDGDLYGVTQGGDTGGKIFRMAISTA